MYSSGMVNSLYFSKHTLRQSAVRWTRCVASWLACLLAIASLTGCGENGLAIPSNSPDGGRALPPEADAEMIAEREAMFPGPPRLVSAVAASNTSVRVMFSEPVSADAEDADNYSIVIPERGACCFSIATSPPC